MTSNTVCRVGIRRMALALCLAMLITSLAIHAQSNSPAPELGASRSIEALLLGTWVVEEREFVVDDIVARQIEGTVHITDRKADGTYTVLVTLSTHFKNKSGRTGPLPECDGKQECVRASATEGIGVYSNGRFQIDYFGENWIDDVFTIADFTMHGRDTNGPIVLQKSQGTSNR